MNKQDCFSLVTTCEPAVWCVVTFLPSCHQVALFTQKQTTELLTSDQIQLNLLKY